MDTIPIVRLPLSVFIVCLSMTSMEACGPSDESAVPPNQSPGSTVAPTTTEASAKTDPQGATKESKESEQKEVCGVDPAKEAARIEALKLKEATARLPFTEREQQDKADERGIASLRKRMADCSKTHVILEPECEAFARSDAALCSRIQSEDVRKSCADLAHLSKATRSRSSKPCSRISHAAGRALCKGAVSGDYQCSGLGKGNLDIACRYLKEGKQDACLSGDGESESLCDIVSLVKALQDQSLATCNAITSANMKRQCLAFVETQPSHCALPNQTPAPCRDVVLSAGIRATQGSSSNPGELYIRAINLFDEIATCKVRLQLPLTEGKKQEEIAVEIQAIAVDQRVQEFTNVLTGPATPKDLTFVSRCDWSSPNPKDRQKGK